MDYEPTDTSIVFGHQFASIAGAGPINGPIQVAVFGWVPMLVMLAVTMTALVQKVINLVGNPTPGNILQLVFAIVLFILGVIVALLGLKKLMEKNEK